MYEKISNDRVSNYTELSKQSSVSTNWISKKCMIITACISDILWLSQKNRLNVIGDVDSCIDSEKSICV